MSSSLPPSSDDPVTAGLARALNDAMARESAGDLDGALRIYLDIVNREPQAHEARYRAGTALLRRGDLDEAVTLLRQVVFTCPDHLAARANLGNALLLLDRLEPARDAFVAVLKAEPDNRNALYGLATILLRLDQPREAAPLTRRLLQALPNSAAALTLDADAQGPIGQVAAAIAQYRQALRIDPGYVPALSGLATILFRQSRFDEAEDYARQAARVNSKDPAPQSLLGTILLAREDWPGAIEAFTAAQTRDPADATSSINLSNAHRRSGNLAAALHHARAAWDLAPSSKAAANALGTALAACGAGKQARAVLMAQGERDQLAFKVWQDLDALERHLEEVAARAQAEAEAEAARQAAARTAQQDEAAESPAQPAADAPTQDDGTAAPHEPETLPLFPEER
ncbi:tetratricopeptide repeat protein [Stappia stellulata]|uniref:tetratricopeptide repeat protein n=1 Tax=Stappia stellulata TaxID=71235 RepID=UPI001CD61F99|nr:tetratricopeptide repeat protein [Stappia stellulata]MCA1243420.1 tetratricopeptide repeat protein [Stappia stellulata]